MANSNGRFRIIDRHDPEILRVIIRRGGKVGATTTEIAEALGISTNGAKGRSRSPAQRIGPRLSRMRIVGLLEKIEPTDERYERWTGSGSKDAAWLPTPEGVILATGKLTKSVEGALGRFNLGQQALALQEIARAGYVEGTEASAQALRRTMQHSLAQRKR